MKPTRAEVEEVLGKPTEGVANPYRQKPMKRLSTLTLIAAAVLMSLCSAARSQTPGPYDDPDAFAVYSALLASKNSTQPEKKKHFIISDTTTDYPNGQKMGCLRATKGHEAELEPVFNSYRKVNAAPLKLTEKLELPFEYELVSPITIHGFFEKKGVEGWQVFYERYPTSDGYNELSAVGFNPEKTLALVYAGNYCGSLCGRGTYNLFEKRNGNWFIRENFHPCAWFS
jgi:hypothetical protein